MPAGQPTQDFVPIQEIRDGIVVLKDNSLRLILMASSLNLALKSEDEQKAILLQFQNFLNSLDFSVQFFVQSRKLDIRPYIAILEERQREQTTELMKLQVVEYIDFIKKFVDSVNIMSKSFFIVIPYAPPVIGAAGSRSPADVLGSVLGPKQSSAKKLEDKLETFEENRTQLEQRMLVIEQGLSRIGIRVAPLGTEELVELFFKMFNPGELEKPIPRQ